MPTFKALVLPHQRKEDGTYNVKIRITQGGKSKYVKTQQYVSDSDIVKKKEKGKEKIKIKNQAIIDLLNEKIVEYKRRLVTAGVVSEHWEVDRIVDFLTTDLKDFRLDFIAFGRRIADERGREGRVGTAKQYRIAMNGLARFVKRESLDISEITSSFLRSFEKFLTSEPAYRGKRNGEAFPTGFSKGKRAISLYPAHIKTIHNLAKLEYNDEDRGIIRIPFSPFDRYKVPPIPKTAHRNLTLEQVQRIIDIPYADGARSIRNLAKDVFILSFAMMGVNSVDLFEMRVVSDYVVTYQRMKTRSRRDDMAEMKVRVEPEIRALFDKYHESDGERVFTFYKRYCSGDIFNKVLNRGLKEIGKIIGVDNLQFYYARHSMATLAANKAGIDISKVDEMLNHSDSTLKLARVYVERDFSVLWEANRKILDLFKWDSLQKEAEV